MTLQILSFNGWDHRRFPVDTYRSIWAFRFKLLEPSADGSTILRSLLSNEHYPNSFTHAYLSPTIEIDGPLVRGPFLLDRLTTDSFERATVKEFWGAIDSHLQDWDPPATREDLGVAELVGNVIDNADEIFRLGANEDARHEVEGLSNILSDDWAEFVAIDRKGGMVLDLVMSMD